MDNQAQLAAFMADTDIESIRQSTLAETGIDIRGVYCLHTGRLVGLFDETVIQFAIDESGDDEDAISDGLIARVIASMRPSPMLNMPDRITLLNLAAKHPVDILCYLANRLNSNRYLTTHRVALLAPYIDRIMLHRQWSELANQGVDLRPWIHWLLEIDAKRNLHDVTPPQIELDRLNRWIVTGTGTFLFQLVTPQNAVEMLAAFEKWAFEQLKEFEDRDRRAVSLANAMRGNTMSQPAYTRSWLENPEIANRKRMEELKKKNRPARQKSEKAKALDDKVQGFLGLLDSILDGDTPIPTPTKAKARVITGGMLFQKKES